MPQAVPKGLTREHVLKALADLDAGIQHPFGPPTGYELVHEGNSYAPKAVVGLACRYLLGHPLNPADFSSGIAPGQAVNVLRELGFNAVRMAEDWTESEVRLIVADYFDMLRAELLGQAYSKTEHRTALSRSLSDRSKGSIEFKHQNISAVLIGLGLPYIEGYKPRSNYQALLVNSVRDFVQEHPAYFDDLAETARVNPAQAPLAATLPVAEIFVPPPDEIIVPHHADQPWLSRKGRKIDFARRDAENRRLGKLGEQWVVNVEKRRLLEVGRDDLANKVEWMSDTSGDGLGYDVLSFDEAKDAEKLIEVKTTGLGKFFPFYVSANEVRCSEAVPEKFHLYRVFDFARTAHLYVLPGSLAVSCRLDPVMYRATIDARDAASD
jgi:hypothetical protein